MAEKPDFTLEDILAEERARREGAGEMDLPPSRQILSPTNLRPQGRRPPQRPLPSPGLSL